MGQALTFGSFQGGDVYLQLLQALLQSFLGSGGCTGLLLSLSAQLLGCLLRCADGASQGGALQLMRSLYRQTFGLNSAADCPTCDSLVTSALRLGGVLTTRHAEVRFGVWYQDQHGAAEAISPQAPHARKLKPPNGKG